MIKTILARIEFVKNLRKKEIYHVFLRLDELKDGDFCRSALSKRGFVHIKTNSVYEIWCQPTRLIEAKMQYPDCLECDLSNFCRAYNGKGVQK